MPCSIAVEFAVLKLEEISLLEFRPSRNHEAEIEHNLLRLIMLKQVLRALKICAPREEFAYENELRETKNDFETEIVNERVNYPNIIIMRAKDCSNFADQ